MKMTRLKIMLKTIPLAYSSSKKLFICDVVLSVVSGLFGVLIVYVTGNLFDTVWLIHGGDSEISVQTVMMALCVYFFVLFVKEIVNWISDSLSFVCMEKSIIALSELLHEKVNKLEAIDFENEKLLDHIDNAGRGMYFVDYCSKNIINLFLRDIPYLLFVGIYLYFLKPVLFFVPVLIFVPVVLSEILRSRMFVRLKDEMAQIKRKVSIYGSYMVEPEYFKETRTLGCFSYFKKLYCDALSQLNMKTWAIERKSQTMDVLAKIITLLGYYGVLFFLFYTLMEGTVTIGEFAAVFASVQTLYQTVNHIVVDRIGSILTDDLPEISSFINCLEIPESKYGDMEEETEDIHLENVSFSYPRRDELAINNLSLTIKQGETVAIVGENGSGKTTLAKLILGIYKPKTGSVLKGSVPYDELSRAGIFGNKSAVFQSYYKYLFNLQDNISISDMDLEMNHERLNNVSQNAGVRYGDAGIFPNGYDTLLSKRFGGVELSGGEWQRVAIARGIYRKSKVIVLDEPTASIDPIEESNVYRRFVDISKGKTAVIITHRLGSTKIADKIIVMKHGQIVQVGSHNELMTEDGIYKTMYQSQAGWYEN